VTLTKPDITTDTILGGRVTLLQPRAGYRVAIDPVLLAASINPKAGDRVLDVGAGTGAVALCLACRAGDAEVSGLEVNPDYRNLAQQSAAINGQNVTFHEGDLFSLSPKLAGQQFDYVVSNPPYWSPESSRPASPGRNGAHFLDGVTLAGWIGQCLALVANKGVLSLIIPAEKIDEALAALTDVAGEAALFPLWPKADVPAKRVILQARKQSRTPLKMCPGLVLHQSDGTYTKAAQKVLRDGQALQLT
jgi:tRNA1(Val) A37 N6-methylase TrmN6